MKHSAGHSPETLEAIDENTGTSLGISRRKLLVGGAAGVGGLMAANVLAALPASASAATGFQSVPVARVFAPRDMGQRGHRRLEPVL